jgi:hypothetical protein
VNHVAQLREEGMALQCIESDSTQHEPDVVIGDIDDTIFSDTAQCNENVVTAAPPSTATSFLFDVRSILAETKAAGRKQNRKMQQSMDLGAFYEFMRNGSNSLLKHGRSGKPKQRTMWIEKNQRLHWTKRSCIVLKDVITISKGCTTDVFQRSITQGFAIHEECCFSIITTAGTVDLQADNAADRDYWVFGLNLVVQQVKQHAIV